MCGRPQLHSALRAGTMRCMAAQVPGLGDRIGASILRAPYVWLAATVMVFLIVNTPLRVVAKDRTHASTAIALAGAALIVYGVTVWVMLPRLMARSKLPVPPDRNLVLRWAIASCPHLLGVAAIAAGGQQWCYALGMIASVVLLVMTAREARRGATPAV